VKALRKQPKGGEGGGEEEKVKDKDKDQGGKEKDKDKDKGKDSTPKLKASSCGPVLSHSCPVTDAVLPIVKSRRPINHSCICNGSS
jgi:hypothetical protein